MPPLLTGLLLLACLTRGSSALELSQFWWSFDADSDSTSLTVCSPTPLLEEGDVTSVVLVVEVSGTTSEHEYDGVPVDDFCAAFSTSGLVRLPRNETAYVLLITALVEGSLVSLTGLAEFPMTVDTATLPCSGNTLTRAIAPPSTAFEDCLSNTASLDNVCYKEGDLSISALCFTLADSAPPGLRVCLEGSSPTPPVADDGVVSISFLQYSSPTPSDATVALAVMGADPAAEAVFWKDGTVRNISLFAEGPWNSTAFAPHYAQYTVCVVETDQDHQPMTSSAASLTDLAVGVADSMNRDDEDALLQFSFINANPQRTYRVSVWSSLPSLGAPLEADSLDCFDVDHNSTCYRFMEYFGAEKEVFVSLEYTDEAWIAGENMVVVPYNITLPINSTEERTA